MPAGPSEPTGEAARGQHVGGAAADGSGFGSAVTALNLAVHDEHGLARLLDRAAHVATVWLPDADWAGFTVTFDGDPFTAGETDPLVLAVDQLQYEAGDGPCLQALRTGTVVRAGPEAAAAAWPRFAAGAAQVGVHSFLAAPLLEGDHVRGVMNLYGRGRAGFEPDEAGRLVVLADLLRRGLGEYAAVTGARTRAAQLQEAIVSRGPIEQAKGILMAIHQIDSTAAFDLLRAESQNTNVKLHDVAADLVARVATAG